MKQERGESKIIGQLPLLAASIEMDASKYAAALS